MAYDPTVFLLLAISFAAMFIMGVGWVFSRLVKKQRSRNVLTLLESQEEARKRRWVDRATNPRLRTQRHSRNFLRDRAGLTKAGGAALLIFAAVAGTAHFKQWPILTTVRHLASAPNCAAARAVGLAPSYRGQPGYWPQHDADNDGLACEPWPRH